MKPIYYLAYACFLQQTKQTRILRPYFYCIPTISFSRHSCFYSCLQYCRFLCSALWKFSAFIRSLIYHTLALGRQHVTHCSPNMDQRHSPSEASYDIIRRPPEQVSPDGSSSPFRIPRRPVAPQAHSSPNITRLGQYEELGSHKHVPHASLSNVPDASETHPLDPRLSGIFEKRSIEQPNSNFFTPQPLPFKPVRPESYNLGLHHRKVYWKTPALAILFFIIGVALAIGHHIYLSSLNGNADINQSWTGRFSLAFAFLTKTFFSAAVALAMRQVLWYTFRRTRKGISISAIDSFFEIQQNLFEFLHREIWCSGILVTIFAIFLWLLPLVTLVSPTSLSTALTSVMATNSACVVPNLNFPLSGTDQTGVSLADAHGTDGVQLASPMAQKLSSLTAYNGEILS